jgi:hypothetical protein
VQPEMMMANAIWTSLGIVALLAFYYLVFRPMMAEGFRERLGRVRGRLEHLAQEGLVKKGPAYQRLTLVTDTLILHATELTLFRVMLASYLGHRFANQLDAIVPFEQLLAATTNDSDRRRLLDIHEHVGMEITRHVLLSSLPGWFVLAGTYPIYLAVQLVRVVRRERVSLARSFDRIVRRIGDKIPGPVRAVELQAMLRVACCAA